MAEDKSLGKPLSNRRQEAFCRFLVFGDERSGAKGGKAAEFPETRNNATQAHIAAGYKAKSPQVASVAASRMLRNVKVQRRIEELRAVQDRILGAFLVRWATLLPDAQQVLIDAMDGKKVTSSQLRAALAIIHRAQGRPRSPQRSPSGNDGNPPVNITMWP